MPRPKDDQRQHCAERGECEAGVSERARSDAPLFAVAGVAAVIAGRALVKALRRPLTPSMQEARDAAAKAAYIREWLSVDPDPLSREEVESWAPSGNAAAAAAVRERLAPTAKLRFGTAGLRARMGAGYDRLNCYTVICATTAVVKVLQEETRELAETRGVAIGFDARHGSRKFAVATAKVFTDAGIAVRLFSKPVPTPLVAYSVLKYELAAAIVITASHNPREDNGYKLFWNNGSQIRPDIAKKVESRMGRVQASTLDLDEARLRSSCLVSDCTEDCVSGYISVGKSLKWRNEDENGSAPALVYTAMHGVGYPFVCKLFEEFALPPVVPVEEQSLEPDPDFRTVSKPNPEEDGALDLAIAKAKERGLSVVIANDPDADRLGAACLDSTGDFRVLTGNEIAALFADYLLQQVPVSDLSTIAMVRSTVSSRFLSRMGDVDGFQVVEGLTGFKWLSYEAEKIEKEGKVCLLAFEEALGYMIRSGVKDKDGVTAAAVFGELCGFWAAQGCSIPERLDTLNEIYGHHLSFNGYLSLSGESTPLEAIFDAARSSGMPKTLGRCRVCAVRDLTKGTDSSQGDGKAILPSDSSSQFLTFTCSSPLGDSAIEDMTISLRGSGTEPKVKYYSEIRISESEKHEGMEILKEAVESAIVSVLRPEENNLRR